MFRNLLITWFGILSIFSVILFSDVAVSANDNNSDSQKTATVDIVKFTIKPASLKMFPGGSMQLIATAYDSKGNKIIVSPEWTIKSDIQSFGEFDKPEGQKVIFSALNSGNGLIVAVYNNLEAEVDVKIFQSKRKK
ncbi:MAG TPA: hypothetical protein PKG60_01125 [Spirochaetota bacterium]|nr:hypothetical protein [Spirochaetota bacterium]HPS85252.1 hypothetical protein [Spirochaetota bacterium]